MEDRKPDLTKGVLAGIAGGLVASYAMNRFQAALAKSGSNGHTADTAGPRDDPATVKAANAIALKVLDRELQPAEKLTAGNVMHYLFGAAAGGFYGLAAETAPASKIGFGTVFGSLLWLVADELAVPQFGLSKPANAYPASAHVSAWASHLVYGITADLVRRGLRAI